MSAWGQTLKLFENDVKKQYVENVVGVENYVYNQLRLRSPVDSGAYRSNHNRTIGAPDYTFSTKKTNSQQPKPIPSGTFFNMFISNGAPYALELENGHSQQAPGGVYGLAYNSAKAKYGL